MKNNLRIACAQINCTVGDLKGNCRKITRYINKAKQYSSDIVIFPELTITGYPPEDLLHKPKFVEDNLDSIKKLAKSIDDIVAVIGFVDKREKWLYNSGAVIYDRAVKGVYHKVHLPNYGVFDEKRYFHAGTNPLVFRFGEITFGVNICEDIWHEQGPSRIQALMGAKLILNINASPYYVTRIKERETILKKQARNNNVFIVYTNLIGGQDELVFDGQSIVVDNKGKVIARAEPFKEDLLIVDLAIPITGKKEKKNIVFFEDKRKDSKMEAMPVRKTKLLEPVAEIYQALVLGLKDYVLKNGFKKVVIGLSGGIDSSLVAVLAVDALGKENVIGVFMPSRYTHRDSRQDAERLAKNLGIRLITISIEPMYKSFLEAFKPHFSGKKSDITEENLQARLRGNILMALSNKFGWLVLSTGNKSEVSVGYTTLYGDMAGGFAVIKDVPKTIVYKLALYRNSKGTAIPDRVLEKEPTAELKRGQKDRDTLPPYEILDPILKSYIEEDKSLNEIVRSGFKKGIVSRVLVMVDKNEYKRRQSPPGIKITPKAFGKDRRMPITNKNNE